MFKLDRELFIQKTNGLMISFMRLIFFIAPFPIFIDLADLSLVTAFPIIIHDFSKKIAAYPVPLVLFCYFYYLGLSIINILTRTNKFSFLIKKNKLVILIAIVFIGILFKSTNMKNTSVLQLTLPLFTILYFTIPSNVALIRSLTKSYMFGIIILCSVHLLSVYITNDYSIRLVDRHLNFGTIFGLQIYQSLVTYPNVLALYIIFFLWLYFWKFEPYANQSFLFLFIYLIILLGSFGATRLFLLDTIILIMTMLLLLINRFFNGFSIWKTSLSFFILTFILFVADINILEGPLSSFNQRGISDRQELITQTVIDMSRNTSYLLFSGSGSIHSAAHNFILNLILGVGFFYSFFYLLILTYLSVSIIKTKIFFIDKFNAMNKNIFYFGLLLMIAGNSTFNAAYTQPLYFFNFIIITCIIISNYNSRFGKENMS